MDTHPTINSLPNELLITILSHLPTHTLLPLASVSHLFHSATLRIFKQRLRRATTLPDYRLILECYPPSAKLSTPYLYCNYLHTDSLDDDSRGVEPEGGLQNVYSHFRPVVQDENRRGRARYPRRRPRRRPETGASNGEAAREHEQEQEKEDEEELEEKRPSQDVYLDAGELFAQLCTVTNLVRVGPKPGLFLSHVNVSDGLVRVWRGWLQDTAAAHRQGERDEKEAVLWADASRTVGLRFRVMEKDIRGEHPVLVGADEELPVAYRLEFEDLLVRASTLLMMMEKSEVQEVAPEGKAIVIAFV